MARADGTLRISELAARAGVPHATIQHYLREGLLPVPVKTGRTMAYYDESCVERIAMIKELQARYLPLGVIRQLLETRHGAKLDDIRADIERAITPPERTLTRDQASSQLGLDAEVLDELERHGIVARSPHGKFPAHDVLILRAVAKLGDAGIDRAAGFRPVDLLIYRDAMRALVALEVTTFLARAGTERREPAELTRLGIAAATWATDLVVAFRQKVIADTIAALPRTTKPRRKKRS